MTGFTTWFDPNKGYGFVTGDDGNDYFAHQKYILKEGYRKLVTKTKVSFVPKMDNGKMIAIDIEPLE